MKKIFYLSAVVVTMAACNTKVDQARDTNKNMVLVDTTGLSKSNVLTDVGDNKFIITPKVVETEQATVISKPVTAKKVSKSKTVYASRANSTSNAVYPQRDKGWSDAAKGTAIGGGAGAILGAVISKENRVKGGIIGAVLGAGAGYAIGRSKDKKSGRVERTRAWKAATK